ncbi:MAG: TSUP family transporter, partial [Sedimenticola sp.]|nr:TSUP family transporter [Sedimenticola sp.]
MPELQLSLDILALLFITGLVAGMVDAIAGGGGLIALPVLLATGMPPIQALATNKLQGSFGTFSSSLYFIRNGLVSLKAIRFMIACTFIGSASGTLLVQSISMDSLATVIPLLLMGIALYFLFSPRISDSEQAARITSGTFSL